jgi:hypothetical protein
MNPVGDLNINIIHKKSIPSIAKLISTYQTPMLKNVDYVTKKT